MQLRTIFVLVSILAPASATPTPLRRSCTGPKAPPTPSPSSITYVLPSTGGSTSLASPNSTLKHIAIGHGMQNYTCTAAGAQPASIGALAVLNDVTNLYPGSGPDALSQDAWNALPSTVLRTTDDPIAEPLPHSESPFPPDTPLAVPGISESLPFLGHHYFKGSVPTFSLNDDAEVLSVQKVQGVPAPANADHGLGNEGAVDWLLLADNSGNDVYRVLTAGGDPTACEKVGETQSVQYAAMYWFY
ncbi:malate dehydrogenase [Xylaria sp. CBS 124048]|nr:malate dehydrogenase [Xylaria sp. CBS 124048]